MDNVFYYMAETILKRLERKLQRELEKGKSDREKEKRQNTEMQNVRESTRKRNA